MFSLGSEAPMKPNLVGYGKIARNTEILSEKSIFLYNKKGASKWI